MMGMLVDMVVAILAVALVGVSYLAYRKSHMRAALYLALAFILFALKKVVEISAEGGAIERDIGLIVDFLEVLVLLLFLMAIWRR